MGAILAQDPDRRKTAARDLLGGGRILFCIGRALYLSIWKSVRIDAEPGDRRAGNLSVLQYSVQQL